MVTRAAARTGDYAFDLSGGRLCLDFANTVGDRGSDQSERAPGLLRRFHRLGGTGRRHDGARGARPAVAPPRRGRPRRARHWLTRSAFARRSTACSPRSPRGARRAPPDLAIVNAAVPAAFERSRLVPSEGGFTLTADVEAGDLAAPLTPVVRSAVDLLVSARCRSRPHLRGDDVRVAVPRHDEKPRAPLVRHEDLRQPREGAALPR